LHQQVISAIDLSIMGKMPEDQLRLESALAETLTARKDLLTADDRKRLVNEVLTKRSAWARWSP
jgi:hypothetical protein